MNSGIESHVPDAAPTSIGQRWLPLVCRSPEWTSPAACPPKPSAGTRIPARVLALQDLAGADDLRGRRDQARDWLVTAGFRVQDGQNVGDYQHFLLERR